MGLAATDSDRGGWRGRAACGWGGRGALGLLAVAALTAILPARDGKLAWGGDLAALVSRPAGKVVLATESRRLSAAELQALAAPHLDTGSLDVRLRRVRDSVTSHPWVYQSRVSWRWPDTLVVEVVEQVPIARWQDGRLVNQFAELFDPGPTAPVARLPLLRGALAARAEITAQYGLLSRMLAAAGLRLTALELSPRGSWTLEIDGRLRVVAGRRGVVARVQRLIALHQSRPRGWLAGLAAVDLRYANGIATRPHGPGTAAGDPEGSLELGLTLRGATDSLAR